jgi:hypothetical protein
MFGDAGDAIIYILFASLLLVLEKKLMLRSNKDVSVHKFTFVTCVASHY